LQGWYGKSYTCRVNRTVVCIVLLLFLTAAAVPAQEDDGDEKIEDTIRRIQEEEQEREDPEAADDDEDSSESGCGLFGEIFWEIFTELFWQYLAAIRFAPYPYAEYSPYRFSSLIPPPTEDRKIVNLQAAGDLSLHFDGTCGNINRLSAQLSALHLNLFNQTIFSAHSSLSSISLNGGLSLLIGGFDLSAFVGAYKVTTTDTVMFSMGLASRLFFPGKLYLDVYNLNAILVDRIRFIHVAATLNYALWRFSIGVGYNYNRIVDNVFAGPCLKAGFWL